MVEGALEAVGGLVVEGEEAGEESVTGGIFGRARFAAGRDRAFGEAAIGGRSEGSTIGRHKAEGLNFIITVADASFSLQVIDNKSLFLCERVFGQDTAMGGRWGWDDVEL